MVQNIDMIMVEILLLTVIVFQLRTMLIRNKKACLGQFEGLRIIGFILLGMYFSLTIIFMIMYIGASL